MLFHRGTTSSLIYMCLLQYSVETQFGDGTLLCNVLMCTGGISDEFSDVRGLFHFAD